MRIGVCTGGGDCPGLNAAIRAVVKHATLNHSMEVVGIYESFQGLMKRPTSTKPLAISDVSEILSRGGTILGTHNKGNPFKEHGWDKSLQLTKEAMKDLKLDGLIVIGGEGTQGIARKLVDAGIPVIGVPKTIDNDLPGTDQTLGFSSCVDLVAESVTRLQSTAESHDRIMVLEVMGRDSGYIALHGGIAGGANVILLPEIPFDIQTVHSKILERKKLGRNYSVVVASEGAKPIGGQSKYYTTTSGSKNLGGIGQEIAQSLFDISKMDTRVTVLGHLQRGGVPNAQDRILSSRFGVYAVDLAAKKEFGSLVCLQGSALGHINYSDINPNERRIIDTNDEILKTARSLGICLGD